MVYKALKIVYNGKVDDTPMSYKWVVEKETQS